MKLTRVPRIQVLHMWNEWSFLYQECEYANSTRSKLNSYTKTFPRKFLKLYIHHEKYSWNSFMWEYGHFCYWICHLCSKSPLLSTVGKWLPAWRNFKSVFCIICTYCKWHFKPKKSSIFYFQVAKDVWLSHTRYVNLIYYGPYDGLY